MGSPSSASRDLQFAHGFLVQLFGFVSAIRSAKDYIYAAVAHTLGEGDVRRGRLKTDIVVFHAKLANQVLHQNMISTGRTFFMGGPKDGTFSYSYMKNQLSSKACGPLSTIQAHYKSSTGALYSIVELGNLVLTELRNIDAEGRTAGHY